MAAVRDTPAAKQERDVLWVPRQVAEPVEVIDPEPTAPYGRRVAPGERRTLVASATRVKLDDRKAIAAIRQRRQGWQSEALDYAYEIPEVGGVLDFKANMLSKIRLYSAVRPDPHGAPVAVDDEESGVDPTEAKIAAETLDRLRNGQGGLSTIVSDITFHFECSGECFAHGHEDPETGEEEWYIRSVDELVVQGDNFGLRTFMGSNQVQKIPDDDIIIRLWVRDRRFSGLAISPMRRILTACENLLLLDREVRATAMTRLTNGYMLWPQNMSFGSVDPTRDSSDGEGRDDPFLADIEQAQITAVQEPGSAQAFAPINVQGPAEAIKEVRHLKIDRQLDNVLDKRIDGQVMRVARGMNMPVETSIGLAQTTFANAAVMKKSEWDAYGEPMAILVVDAITSGYYQWMLEEAGIPRERAREHFVWFDPTDALAAPDPVDNADKGLDDGLIKEETWRTVKGFTEADAPDDDEVIRRMLLKATRFDPFVLAQLLKITGLAPEIDIPNPPAGILGEAQEPAVQASALALVAAAPKPSRKAEHLARRLAEIDRDLRTRLRTAAELALRRVLERAGNKVKNAARKNPAALTAAKDAPPRLVAASVGKNVVNALGLSDQSLVEGGFEELTRDFGAWVDVAYTQAVGEIERAVGPLDQAVKQQLMHDATRSGQSATEWLGQQMNKLAAARLYDPVSTSAGGEAGVSSSVPEVIVRAAVGIAGGDDPQIGEGGSAASSTGGWLGGVGTGPLVLGQVGAVEAYQWDWGSAPRTPFPPHLDLNGVIVTSFEDEALINDEGFPDTPYFYPGDREACVCDFIPVLVIDEQAPEGEAE